MHDLFRLIVRQSIMLSLFSQEKGFLRAALHIVEDKVYKYKSQLQQTGEG